jgi:hypothetical protein
MRARVLFAGLVAISTVVIAPPAPAKVSIAEARITGPEIDGEIRIGRRQTWSLWEYGIGPVGAGPPDPRPDSVEALGLSPSDLGVRYLVTYRFDPGYPNDVIRQNLYPYAEGGPVTYTPPRQKLTGLFGERGLMPVIPGWDQSGSVGFLRYLMNHGLPERSPTAPVTTRDAAPGTAPEADTRPWAAVVVVLVGLAAVSWATAAVRRRMLAVRQVNR